MADLTRAATQLLRKLNLEVFQDSIDISKLGIGVALVEDFASELQAEYRVSVGEPGDRCPTCGSKDRASRLLSCSGLQENVWHSAVVERVEGQK